MTRFAVGLGSNLGDRISHLRAALASLEEMGSVQAVSSLYETEPIGGPDQDPFLNAVVLIETAATPLQVLAELQRVEDEAGRARRQRWGPRTLDLDLLTSDGSPQEEGGLVLPHPRARERRFVLEPLAEVWPEADVGGGRTAADSLGDTAGQEVEVLIRNWRSANSRLGAVLVGAQLVLIAIVAVGMAYDGSLPDGEVGGTRVIGAGLCVIGGGLAFVSSRRLGTGITPRSEPRPDATLVESGPYALARHPIYGGVFLFILGASLVVDSLIGSVASLALLGFFYLKTRYEERLLRVRYPGYRAYQQRVGRRLIPFLF